MVSKLNDDCLYYIFQYLEEDPFTLFTCVLVDKQWCRNSIPILWSNPWKDSNKRYYDGSITLIDTYISALPNETKQDLINEIIIKPNIMKSNSTFEYEKFMKILNVFELEYHIRKWVSSQPVKFDFTNNNNQRKIGSGIVGGGGLGGGVKNNYYNNNLNNNNNNNNHYYYNNNKRRSKIQPDYDRDTRILMSELLYLFLVNSPKIDTLCISDFDKNFSFILKIADQEPEAKKCLQNLNHLKLSTHQPISTSSLLTRLSEISRNIEYLEIENCNINSFELKRLINVQKNLKFLSIQFVVNQPYQIHHDSNNVLNELSSKAISIKKIELRDAADIFIIFNSFVNLIELIINNNDKCNLQKWEHLSNVNNLKNLKKLVIHNKKGPIFFKILSNFINNSHCNLDQIIISSSKPQDKNHLSLLIKSISNICTNLTFFKGLISKDHLLEFSLLLKNCINLKYLHIFPLKTSWDNEIFEFDDLLKQMIQFLSFNLIKLILENGWLISDINLFKTFLDGRKSLDLPSISFNAHHSITFNYKELEDLCEIYKKNDYLLDYHFS